MILKISLKWGLSLGIAVSIATQILTWLGFGLTNWFIFVSIILTVIAIALASNEVQVENQGKLPFLNALTLVIVSVLIARFIFQIYMFVYTRYIDPSWIDTVAESWTVMLQEAGTTAEQIDVQIQSFRKAYEFVPMFTSALVLYGIPQFFWGFITALFFVFDVKGRFKTLRG